MQKKSWHLKFLLKILINYIVKIHVNYITFGTWLDHNKNMASHYSTYSFPLKMNTIVAVQWLVYMLVTNINSITFFLIA